MRDQPRRRPRGRSWSLAIVAVGGLVVLGRGLLPASSRTGAGQAATAPARISATVIASGSRMAALQAILQPGVPAAFSGYRAPRTSSVPAPAPLYRPFTGHRPLRIMVVGDSVGVTFARGLSVWALSHNAQVLDAARYWCALGRGLPISHGLGVTPPGNGCDDWGTRWKDDIAQFDPDVVLVYFSIWETAPRVLPGQTALVQPGSAALDAWQLGEYRAAADLLSARGAPVVWFTVPCEKTPIVRGSPMWYVDRVTIPALAASRPAVHVIDLDHEMCAGGVSPSFGGVADARPRNGHYSIAGGAAVSRWVMPIVLGDAPNPKTFGETNPPPPPPPQIIRTTS